MAKLIALLRGVNVAGHNRLKMKDLEDACSTLGYRDAITYLQSGNVVFKTEKPPEVAATALEEELKKKLNLEVWVVCKSQAQLKRILGSSPFPSSSESETKKLHVTFLSKVPKPENLSRISQRTFGKDEFHLQSTEIFISCQGSYGKTKLSNAFFEKALDLKATTRNWDTVTALSEL